MCQASIALSARAETEDLRKYGRCSVGKANNGESGTIRDGTSIKIVANADIAKMVFSDLLRSSRIFSDLHVWPSSIPVEARRGEL